MYKHVLKNCMAKTDIQLAWMQHTLILNALVFVAYYEF
jgi:hypothetical protein